MGEEDPIVRKFLIECARIELECLEEIKRTFGNVYVIILSEPPAHFYIEPKDPNARIWILQPYHFPETDVFFIVSRVPFRVVILDEEEKVEIQSRGVDEWIRELYSKIKD